MTSDDLKRIFLGPTLFRLDTLLSPRLVPVVYVTGLGAILIWAIKHLFATFGTNFGEGLWGLLEIAVFGAFMLVVLRAACEALLVYFKAHEEAADAVSRTRISSSLLEDVRDAIHDIAEDEPYEDETSEGAATSEPTTPAVRRTAKRTPPPPAAKPDI